MGQGAKKGMGQWDKLSFLLKSPPPPTITIHDEAGQQQCGVVQQEEDVCMFVYDTSELVPIKNVFFPLLIYVYATS
jgi:hypothetical protein